MIYVKAAMAAIGATGIVAKLIGAGVLLASLLAVYGGWHHHVYKSGYDRAISDIAREDTKALAVATERHEAWRECRARNGVWDQTERKCK